MVLSGDDKEKAARPLATEHHSDSLTLPPTIPTPTCVQYGAWMVVQDRRKDIKVNKRESVKGKNNLLSSNRASGVWMHQENEVTSEELLHVA